MNTDRTKRHRCRIPPPRGNSVPAGFWCSADWGCFSYVAHFAFIPIALALLFALVLSGPVEALYKRRVPRTLSALVILALALGTIIAVTAALLWKPTQYWYGEAPQMIRAVKQKIAPAAQIVNRFDDIGTSAGSITNTTPGRGGARAIAAPAVASSSLGSSIIGSSLGAVVSSVTFAILTLFLLTGGPPMPARMTAAFVDDLNGAHILTIIEAVRPRSRAVLTP